MGILKMLQNLMGGGGVGQGNLIVTQAKPSTPPSWAINNDCYLDESNVYYTWPNTAQGGAKAD